MARVLIVDDNEDLLDTYEVLLASEGYDVSRASDGATGLLAICRDHPDVVLLDMMMPDVDGLQLLARMPIECAPPLPDVIAASGVEGYRQEALARGARAFLSKPVEFDVLLEAVGAAASHQPVATDVLRHNKEDSVAARTRAALLRQELVASLPARLLVEVRARLRALTRWLRRYYGFGAALVQLAERDVMRIEAQCGAPSPWVEGYRYPLELSYCNDVVQSGSSLVLGDPRHHPVFAQHPALARGVAFYTGVPLTTWSGAVIGTLCLIDVQPHVMHAEDVHLLAALGLHVAHALEELAAGLDVEDELVVDGEGLFAGDLVPLLTQVAVQRAARVGGVAAVGIAQLPGRFDAAEATRAAYAGEANGVAVARRARDELAIIVTGRHARRALADALAAAVRAVAVRAVGSAFCRLDPGRAVAHESELAARLLELAGETRRAGLIGGDLAPGVEIH